MAKPFLLTISFLIIASIVGCFNSEKTAKTKPEENISTLSTEDTLIKKYKDTAQAKINYLIEFMGEHDIEDTLFRYYVKSNFSESYFNEHMWTQVHEYKNGFFIGTLANDPLHIKKLKFMDTVKVRKQDVEDWILQDFLTNTKVGGYSSEYLHKTSK